MARRHRGADPGHRRRVGIYPAPEHKGKLSGLFGNYDGKPEGDLVVRGGAAIPEQPSFEQLYRSFADSWRITASLFDYAAGQDTNTFTDRSYPDRPVTARDLPNRATAEAVCRAA